MEGRGIPDEGRLSAALAARGFSTTIVAFMSTFFEKELVGMMLLDTFVTLDFKTPHEGAFRRDKPGSILFRDEVGIDPTVANRCCFNKNQIKFNHKIQFKPSNDTILHNKIVQNLT